MSRVLCTGRVAHDVGLSVHAIRFYEAEGLLKAPVRNDGRFRIFSDQEVHHLKFIRRAQELGFSLAEIRELLVVQRISQQACAHVRDLLANALQQVDDKVGDLLRLQRELKAALLKCSRDPRRFGAIAEKVCPVLEELGRPPGSNN